MALIKYTGFYIIKEVFTKKMKFLANIFGKRLSELDKLPVSLIENQDTEVPIPKLVVSACKYIEENVHMLKEFTDRSFLLKDKKL